MIERAQRGMTLQFSVRPHARPMLFAVYAGTVALMLLLLGIDPRIIGSRELILAIIAAFACIALVPVALWLAIGRDSLTVGPDYVGLELRLADFTFWRVRVRVPAIEAVGVSREPVVRRMKRTHWEKYLVDGRSTVFLRADARTRVWAGAWRLTDGDAKAVADAIMSAAPQAVWAEHIRPVARVSSPEATSLAGAGAAKRWGAYCPRCGRRVRVPWWNLGAGPYGANPIPIDCEACGATSVVSGLTQILAMGGAGVVGLGWVGIWIVLEAPIEWLPLSIPAGLVALYGLNRLAMRLEITDQFEA